MLHGLTWVWVSSMKVIFGFCIIVDAEPCVGLICLILVPGGPEGSTPALVQLI